MKKFVQNANRWPELFPHVVIIIDNWIVLNHVSTGPGPSEHANIIKILYLLDEFLPPEIRKRDEFFQKVLHDFWKIVNLFNPKFSFSD